MERLVLAPVRPGHHSQNWELTESRVGPLGRRKAAPSRTVSRRWRRRVRPLARVEPGHARRDVIESSSPGSAAGIMIHCGNLSDHRLVGKRGANPAANSV